MGEKANFTIEVKSEAIKNKSYQIKRLSEENRSLKILYNKEKKDHEISCRQNDELNWKIESCRTSELPQSFSQENKLQTEDVKENDAKDETCKFQILNASTLNDHGDNRCPEG